MEEENILLRMEGLNMGTGRMENWLTGRNKGLVIIKKDLLDSCIFAKNKS